ncbi:hypothetical protein WICANDRAFT_82148 [Wickerhamomyces anomalus NRRL Y-366-8]|uniref:Uncharacterized protein n=1 Tax=Wickerhamomyces anomalus (strain ATCC 58044 / CBS 1984 / NCYC 433 / NRRL Y-366-8) TaxID=683960 RepID=A0A1E3P9H4_WICAA|nr:uncharacterized protein WICANDRAFT_82148 [Wickerhamomyces anomalus NRRL Y-366-8]ODQ62018.1 hypothetical protein WICANDRAFT_82148 [Wickerhamomyces anomalus NRRL Y-366-8]
MANIISDSLTTSSRGTSITMIHTTSRLRPGCKFTKPLSIKRSNKQLSVQEEPINTQSLGKIFTC